MKTQSFDYFEFRYLISSNNIRHNSIWFHPYTEIMSFFNIYYDNLEKLEKFLSELSQLDNMKENRLTRGSNEHYLIADSNYMEFNVTLPMFEPLIVPTRVFIEILKKFKKWLEEYENVQIPGIIPESKLNTWVPVPKEFVKDEWWELNKHKP